MDHKQNPGQEEGFDPQELEQPTLLPEDTQAPEEALPVIQELAFEEAPAEEEVIAEAEVIAEEDAPVIQEPSAEEADSDEVDIPPFMNHTSAAEDLSDAPEAPEVTHEIIPDEQAMDSQDLPEPITEEPTDILDDPELNELIAVPDPSEEQEEELLDQEYRDNSGDFDDVFSTAAPEEKEPVRHQIARKGRPKRKKGEGLLGIPNILATFVWLALILAIGVTLGRMLWVCAADVLAFGREDKVVTITVYEADTMEDIVEKLYENGLIRYKSLFNLYASISDAEEEIRPGIYDLNTRYDYHALVNFMSPSSNREVVEVMIPEGYTCRQVFALLEENKVCTSVDLASYAATGELDEYWFLQDVERGDPYCLEGFLFPDTYEFYKNDSPRNILQKMLNNFDYRFSDEMRAKIETLNANVTGGTFTIREIVIVASLIEKETSSASESPTIASVIYNRLFRWGSTPAYLNIDASIIYAQDGESDVIDTKIDSPFNTYTHIGLTPTPIANPGLASLKAALSPATTNYYYYVLNPATWSHQFSTTLEEHERYRAQFAAASEG